MNFARLAGYAVAQAVLALLTLVCPALALEAPSASAPIEIVNCAAGPPLKLGAEDARAVLDDADRDALILEMNARYPMLARDGFAPDAILLWRQPKPERLLYVSMQAKTTSDGTACFLATFVAERFVLTPALLKKYLSPG